MKQILKLHAYTSAIQVITLTSLLSCLVLNCSSMLVSSQVDASGTITATALHNALV